jgi:hypothetical protein
MLHAHAVLINTGVHYRCVGLLQVDSPLADRQHNDNFYNDAATGKIDNSVQHLYV